MLKIYLKIKESNKIVQTLWIGDSLTKIEQACIKRYIDNNHIVHLYTYGPIKNLPIISSDNKEKFIIKDGNEILDKNEIFRYKNGSVSAFSNLFRFMLLYKKGGYWSDLDLINLKTLDFANDIVFVSEPTPDYKKNIPTTCLVKLKKNSIIARKLIDLCYNYKNKIISGEIEWGLGPKALKMIIEEYNLDNNIKPWYTVCSCHPNDTLSLFNTYYRQLNNKKEIIDKTNIPNSMYGVHIWNKVINEYKLLDTKINKDSFIYYLIK